MKKILFLLLIASFSVAAWAAELTMYAAPAAAGNGDGSSPENAARLWDYKLWRRVKNALEKSPVTLQLLPGNYYTELPAKKKPALSSGAWGMKSTYSHCGEPQITQVYFPGTPMTAKRSKATFSG